MSKLPCLTKSEDGEEEKEGANMSLYLLVDGFGKGTQNVLATTRPSNRNPDTQISFSLECPGLLGEKEENLAILADTIRDNEAVTQLDVSNNLLTGGNMLYNTVSGKSDRCGVGDDSELDLSGTHTLAGCIKGSTSITNLALTNCGLTSSALEVIAAAIPTMESLWFIELFRNEGMNDAGLSIFMKAVEESKSVKTVSGLTEAETTADYSKLGLSSMDAKIVAADVQLNRFASNLTSITMRSTGDRNKPSDYVLDTEQDEVELEDQGLGPADLELLANWMRRTTYSSINVSNNPLFGNLDVAPLTIVLLAPPGCLKYHYASVLAKRYGITHIDASKLLKSAGQEYLKEKKQELTKMTLKELRERAREERIDGARIKHALGEEDPRIAITDVIMKRYEALEDTDGKSSIESGKMVADRFIAGPLQRALAGAAASGWVLTGFPRTEAQVHMLQGMHASPFMVVVLEAETDECKRGCTHRATDPETGEVYDMKRRKPAHPDIVQRLVKRKDDAPSIVTLRINHFHSQCHGVVRSLDPKDEITYRMSTSVEASQTLGDIIELVEAVRSGLTTDSNEDFLIDLFTAADLDHGGSVEMPELYEAMQNAGVQIKEDQLVAIIDAGDKDGDHQLSMEEFLKCFNDTVEEGEIDVSDLIETATSGGQDHTGWRTFCNSLKEAPKTVKLNVAAVGMDAVAAATLAESLNDELTDLNTRGNPCGWGGVAALADAYKGKPQLVSVLGLSSGLETLDLRGFTPSSSALLAEEIKDGRSLSEVNTITVNSTGKIEDPRKIYLRSDMKKLDLSDVNFGPADALLLAAFLRKNHHFNSSLRSLKATSTGDLTNTDVNRVYTLTSQDPEIDLKEKMLGTQDAILLAAWISLPDVRLNVKGLNMLGNPIGDEGLEKVIQMFDADNIPEDMPLNPGAAPLAKINGVCGIKRGQDEADWSNKQLSVFDCAIIAADIKFSLENAYSIVSVINLSGTPLAKEAKRSLANVLPEADLMTLSIDLGAQHTDGHAQTINLDSQAKAISAKDAQLNPIDVYLLSKWLQAPTPKDNAASIDLSGNFISGSRNMASEYAEPQYELDTDLFGLKEMLSALTESNVEDIDISDNYFGEPAQKLVTKCLEEAASKKKRFQRICLGTTGESGVSKEFTLDLRHQYIDLEAHLLGPVDAELVLAWYPQSAATSMCLCHNPSFDNPEGFLKRFEDPESNLQSICGVEKGADRIDWAQAEIVPTDLLLLAAEMKMARAAADVQRLDLSRSHIDEEGGQKIAEALKSATSSKLEIVVIGGRAAVGVTLIFEGRIARIVETKGKAGEEEAAGRLRYIDDGTFSDWIAQEKLEPATVPCSLSFKDDTDELDASGTGMTNGEAHMVAAWLEIRTTKITSLTLAGNVISGATRQEKEGKILFTGLDTHPSGVEALCRAMNGGGAGVTLLDLANCGMGAASTLLIAKALGSDGKFRQHIERIILDGNYVTDSRFRVYDGDEEASWKYDHDLTAIKALGQVLQNAPHLGALSLCGCHIGPVGLSTFASSVAWPKVSLKSLELGNNPFSSEATSVQTDDNTGTDAIVGLCAALCRGSKLETLGLDRTGCGPRSLPHISKAALALSELKKLNVSGNLIGTLYTRPVEGADVHEDVRKGCVAAYQNHFGEVMRDPDADGDIKLRWLMSNSESDWINEAALAPVVESLSAIASDHSHIQTFASTLHTIETCDVSYCGFDHFSVAMLVDNVEWTNCSLKELDLSGNSLGDDGRGTVSRYCEQNNVQVTLAKSELELEAMADAEAKAADAFRVASKLEEESQRANQEAQERLAAATEAEQQAAGNLEQDEIDRAAAERKAAEADVAIRKQEAAQHEAANAIAQAQAQIAAHQVAEEQLMAARQKTKPRMFHHVKKSDKKALKAAEAAMESGAVLQMHEGTEKEEEAVTAAQTALEEAHSSCLSHKELDEARANLDKCESLLEMKHKDVLAKELFRLKDKEEQAQARVDDLRKKEKGHTTADKVAKRAAEDTALRERARSEIEEAKKMAQAAKTKQENALQARIEADREGMKGLGLARQVRKARESALDQQSTTVDTIVIDDDARESVQFGVECLTGAVSSTARRKLTAFIILAVLTTGMGLATVIQFYNARISGSREGGTLAYFVFVTALTLPFVAVWGIHGAMQRDTQRVRCFAYIQYMLVCAYLAIGTTLVLQQKSEGTVESALGKLQLASQELSETESTGGEMLSFASAFLSFVTAFVALKLFCPWSLRPPQSHHQSHWMDHPKSNIRRKIQVRFVEAWYGLYEITQVSAIVLLLVILGTQSPTTKPDKASVFSLFVLELFVGFLFSSGCLLDVLMTRSFSFVNICDIICVLASWAFIDWPQNNYLTPLVSLLRCARVVRPMVALAELESLVDDINAMTLIAMAFLGHASLYQALVLFTLFSLLCCCIVTVNLYGGAIQYTCDLSLVPAAAESWVCPISLQGSQPEGQAAICGEGEDSLCFQLNPPRALGADETGTRGFDSVPQAFMSMLVHMSGDGGMNEIPAALLDADATGSSYAWTVFAVLFVVLRWVILTMLLSLGVYTLLDAEQTVKSHNDHLADARSSVKKGSKISLGNYGHKASAVNFDESREEMATSLKELDWEASENNLCLNFEVGSTRNQLKNIATSNRFRSTVVTMIYLWTAVLCTKTDETSTDATDVDNWAVVRHLLEMVLIAFFVLEIVICMVAFGLRRFFTSTEHVLDFIFCLITCAGFITTYFSFLIEIGCAASIESKSVFGGNDTSVMMSMEQEQAKLACVEESISDSTRKFFGVMRIFQVFRMLYKSEDVNDVMIKAFSNWQLVLGLFALVVVLIVCFSVVGMHLVGGKLGTGSEYDGGLCCSDIQDMPRSNLETFSNAVIVSVQVMLNDGWKNVLAFYWSQQKSAVLFFVVLFFVVRGILFNALRAMMLVNFALDEDKKIPKQMQRHFYKSQKKAEARVRRKLIDVVLDKDLDDDGLDEEEEDAVDDLVEMLRRDDDPKHRSVLCFRANGKVRIAAAMIETSSLFIGLQVVIILISCGWLAVESEQTLEGLRDSKEDIGLCIKYAVAFIFTAEALVKAVSSGLLFRSGPSIPYLQVTHNAWDFAFLLTLILSEMEIFRDYCSTKGIEENHLRVIGGLGPIVGLMQVSPIRREVNAFIATLPAIATVGVPLIFVVIGFSLAGVELFAGVMKKCHCPPAVESNATAGGDAVSGWEWCHSGTAISCNKSDPIQEYPCNEVLMSMLHVEITNQTGCEKRGYNWDNPVLTGSFDDAVEAAKALTKASTSGGTDLLYAMMDAANVKGEMPSINNSAGSAAVFLAVYHSVVSVFLLNLFFAVMGTSFATKTGSDLITLTGQRWVACVKTSERFQPIFDQEDLYRPTQSSHLYRPRLAVHRKLRSNTFRTSSLLAVILNCVLLASEHYPAAPEYEAIVPMVHLGFLALFIVECVLKVFAFGPLTYFGDPWLTLDFIYLALATFMPGMVFLKLLRCIKTGSHNGAVETLIELMRNTGRCLENIIGTVAIMAVLIGMYAVLGKQLYGQAIMSAPHSHFGDIRSAACCLFQVVSGESYGKLVAQLVSEGYEEYVALAYFFSFYVLLNFVCCNIVFVIVVDTFYLNRLGHDLLTADELWSAFKYKSEDSSIENEGHSP